MIEKRRAPNRLGAKTPQPTTSQQSYEEPIIPQLRKDCPQVWQILLPIVIRQNILVLKSLFQPWLLLVQLNLGRTHHYGNPLNNKSFNPCL